MRHTYSTSQWLPYPVPRVFAFFASPANLPRLMPRWQATRIESIALVPAPNPPEGPMGQPAAGAGTRMKLTFRPFPFSPVRLAWDAEISEFTWNDHFCDIQLARGPFAYWRHCHRVHEESRDGTAGTLLVDQLEYELPFPSLTELPHPRLIRPQIEAAFAFRHKRTAELLAKTN